ncbi:hypothetical protein Dimus_026916, partial [Dionaea muscipula]
DPVVDEVAQATAAVDGTEAIVDEAAAEVVVDEVVEIARAAAAAVEEEIDKAEENLTQKIDENSTRLTTVEETLASLLKAQ